MFELVLIVCAFANDYSVELQCSDIRKQVESCAVEIKLPPGIMIKGVECVPKPKQVPVAKHVQGEIPA